MERQINKNFSFLHKAITTQEYSADGKLINGYRGVVLEGSSRSAKTWSSVDMIILLCVRYETNCVINIVKETYNEFKTTLYNDFNKRLPMFGIVSPFENAKEVQSFKIFGNKINLIGADKPSKFHGAQCDYLYINEALPISKAIFDQAEMRCTKFWWMDYNPSVTEHWIFNSIIPRPDVGFLHTTFLDNPHVSFQERNKILSYEPTKENIEQGTADQFMWDVYGLGKRGAMTGLIFPNVTYIDKFPEIAHTFGLDFGFTTDPTALVKFAQEGENIYLELLIYEPIEDPNTMVAMFGAIGIEKHIPITADSADKYISEHKGAIEMVMALRMFDYQVEKVKKTNSVMFHLMKMKQKKIHVVRNHLYGFAKKEFENYKLKEINGIAINQPEDKHNHMHDAARYSFMAYNSHQSIW